MVFGGPKGHLVLGMILQVTPRHHPQGGTATPRHTAAMSPKSRSTSVARVAPPRRPEDGKMTHPWAPGDQGFAIPVVTW